MWEAYVDETGFQVEIFKDRESADKWLRNKLIISSQSLNQFCGLE
jgi:hypothetical protein